MYYSVLFFSNKYEFATRKEFISGLKIIKS